MAAAAGEWSTHKPAVAGTEKKKNNNANANAKLILNQSSSIVMRIDYGNKVTISSERTVRVCAHIGR